MIGLPDRAAAAARSLPVDQVRRLAALLLSLLPDSPFLAATAEPLLQGSSPDSPDGRARIGAVGAGLLGALATPGSPAASTPLARLARWAGLSGFELDLLLVSLLPELDERFGDLFAQLSGRPGLRRPTLGGAVRVLLGDDVDRGLTRARLGDSALWRRGLLRPAGPDDAFFDRLLVPRSVVSAALEGRAAADLDGRPGRLFVTEPLADPARARELEYRPALREAAEEAARWFALHERALLQLVCDPPDLARGKAEAVAAALGCGLLEAEGVDGDEEAIGELLLAGHLLDRLVFILPRADVTRVELPRGAPPGRWILAAGPTLAVDAPDAVPARRVPLAAPRPVEQAAVWTRVLDEVGAEARVDVLANQTRLTVAQIRGAALLAAEHARLDGRASAGHGDVVRALEETVGSPGSPLARSSRPRVGWSRLVLAKRSKDRLGELVRRLQYRVTVQDRWGLGGAGGRGDGLVTLLHGESGTGKTLAAEAIATQLSLPLLSIDLSRVVSKYIGETEKHLSALFDAAGGFRAVLFFDEADALFGKRTGVRDAHDRYANIETNYLLQRLETFDGVAILATNLLQNLDDAFTRRIQFIVHLPRPDPGLQKLIWRRHLPLDRLSPEIDLNELVTRFDLVGGEIRNAGLSAAYAAAARGGEITTDLLHAAVREELEKKGRPAPG